MPKPNFFATTATPLLYKATSPSNPQLVHYFLADNNNLSLGQVRTVCNSLELLGLLNEISMVFIQAGTYHPKKDYPFEVTARTEHDNEDLDNAEHHKEDAPHAQHIACHRVKKTVNAKNSITETVVSMAENREMPVFTMQTKEDRAVHEITALFKIATKPQNIVKALVAGPIGNFIRAMQSYKTDKKEKEILARDYMEGRLEFADELIARHPIITEEMMVKSVDDWCKHGYQGQQDTPMTKTPLLGKNGLLKKEYFSNEIETGLRNGGALFIVPQGALFLKEYGLLARLKDEGWIIDPVRTKADIVCRQTDIPMMDVIPADEPAAVAVPA